MEEENDVAMVTNYHTEEYEKIEAAVVDSKDNPDDPIVQVARRNNISRKQLVRGKVVLGCAINPVLDEYRSGSFVFDGGGRISGTSRRTSGRGVSMRCATKTPVV